MKIRLNEEDLQKIYLKMGGYGHMTLYDRAARVVWARAERGHAPKFWVNYYFKNFKDLEEFMNGYLVVKTNALFRKSKNSVTIINSKIEIEL